MLPPGNAISGAATSELVGNFATAAATSELVGNFATAAATSREPAGSIRNTKSRYRGDDLQTQY